MPISDTKGMPLNYKRMRKERERNGWNQREAAERVEPAMSVQRWNDIESGRKADITLTTLDRIARALGVKAADLLK